MKRAFTSISAAAVTLALAAAALAAPVPHSTKKADPPHQPSKAPHLSKWQQHVLDELHASAPGDEYFGRMKMSYLGINNTFHDDAIRAGAYTTDQRLVSAVSFADEALNAWAKKYPNDPQLARSYFLAFQMYRKVWTPDGQQKAWNYMHIIAKKWPSSFFGKTINADLKTGFTEHYFAVAVPCATLASATPAPTATPTRAPGQPGIDILPVPCLTPTPSPSPTPSTSPSASPSASASASASPTGTATPTPSPSTSATPSPSSSVSPSPAPTPTKN